jgi:ketosteroid isomerase-like protein
MPARSPEELDKLFMENMNAGDVEAVVALYEVEATLAPQPGQTVTGTAAIRDAIRGFNGSRVEPPRDRARR